MGVASGMPCDADLLALLPQWMAPNPRYHADVTDGEKWAMRHLPGYARWYRFMLMWQSSDKLLELVRAEEDWPDFPHTANAASAARREIFVKWIQDQVGDDEEDDADPAHIALQGGVLLRIDLSHAELPSRRNEVVH